MLHRFLGSSIVIALVLFGLPGDASAQLTNRYTAGVMFGFGSPTGGSGSNSTGIGEIYLVDDQFDLGYQLLFNMETRKDVLFGVRYGQLDVELASPTVLALFDAPIDTELTYATLSGEYRRSAGIYQSGLFLGLGYYSVDGQDIFEDTTGLGLTVGTTGDFRINDRWSVLLEFSAHYADVDYGQFFIMGHAGVGFHF